MSNWILSLIAGACGLAAFVLPDRAEARAAEMQVERVDTAVARLDGVSVRVEWASGESSGILRVQARRAHAPELGYRFSDLDWTCPLRRTASGWQCEGDVVAAGMRPGRLALELDAVTTRASLVQGSARISMDRDAGSPYLTHIDLGQVPVRWAQALVNQAWPDARFGAGRLTGELVVDASAARPLAVDAMLAIDGLSLDTPDGRIAAEGLGARLALRSTLGTQPWFAVDGRLQGGELLFGTAYISLGQRQVDLAGEAQRIEGGEWQLSGLRWRDGRLVEADARGRLGADASLQALGVDLRSDALDELGPAYLSGWLGIAGLADLHLDGRADMHVDMAGGRLQTLDLELARAGIDDPRGRFGFHGLRGDLRFSDTSPVDSELRWEGGMLYGLDFGPARLPFSSGDGTLQSREPVHLAMLGGEVTLDDVRIRPPDGDAGLDVRFGLALDELDVGALSAALGWPPFSGRLSGRMPVARYANDRLDLEGGLLMNLFAGRVEVSSLSMERPFGVAPTLSSDIALEGLDLEALTSVFGFGSITGRLHGRIDGLRLVNWTPVAFDAEMHTERERGVRQRISQRAVQDLSSVGDASFMGSLQGQLIGLFDDFRYSRIGIGCTLIDEVCRMDGLGSAGRGFVIVEGAGIPRLSVVGYNQRVDWPTLVERLAAIGSGDVAPVVE